jgi:predicted RNA-binding Zn ribbon-like protein
MSGQSGGNLAGSSQPNFYFIANLPWLDFVNTEPVQRGKRVDLLSGPAEVIAWLEAAGVLASESAQRIVDRWGRSGQRELIYREAVALRAALRAGAERLAAGKPVGDDTVRVINRVLASRPVYPQLSRKGKGYTTRLEPLSDAPLHLLVPVAESAAWLLEHGERSLVRRCEGPECVLFFYDTTKNKSRRWCSMEACGSRAKAVAYYRRKHRRGNQSADS